MSNGPDSPPEQPLVLDTSVVVKWYLPEENSHEAIALLDTEFFERFAFIASVTLQPELFNTFWQRYRRQLLDRNEVREMWDDYCLSAPITLYDSSDLVERAAELVLESEIIIYDALFVALAEYTGTSVVTSDRALLNSLTGTDYAELVTPLADAAQWFRS